MAMAVSREQMLVVGLPLILIALDLFSAITAPLPKASHRHDPETVPRITKVGDVRSFAGSLDPLSTGGNFHISYCTSCAYKNTAVQTKNMLQTDFPKTQVFLSNYPPAKYKQLLSKLVPVAQFGAMGLALAGDRIFPLLGYLAPPSWYNMLRQNRFGAVASSWLIGNILQNALQSTGAFEVYYDGDLIFSKLQEKRFPNDSELRDLIDRALQRKTGGIL